MSDMIDDTFKGLANPRSIIPVGRDDIADRPGDALVELVREHRAQGGFAPKSALTDEMNADFAPTPGFVKIANLTANPGAEQAREIAKE